MEARTGHLGPMVTRGNAEGSSYPAAGCSVQSAVCSRRRGLRKQAGFTLVEVLLVVFVLALSALMFAATFPTSQISRMKAAHMSYATGLAQQKMEEIKAAGYSDIQLTTGNGVDTPLSILPNGNQRVKITQYSPTVKKVEVKITWSGYRRVGGEIELITLVSDRS